MVREISGRRRRQMGESPNSAVRFERMSRDARRLYLKERLYEVEDMIESRLFRTSVDTMTTMGSLEEKDNIESDWEEYLELHYLEASRQAILESMRNIHYPHSIRWPPRSRD